MSLSSGWWCSLVNSPFEAGTDAKHPTLILSFLKAAVLDHSLPQRQLQRPQRRRRYRPAQEKSKVVECNYQPSSVPFGAGRQRLLMFSRGAIFMNAYKVGYLIGSLAKGSINRKLAKALVNLA